MRMNVMHLPMHGGLRRRYAVSAISENALIIVKF